MQNYFLSKKWELELNIIIDDGEWETMCIRSRKGINSNMWKEFDWKMKTRFFKTPSVVSRCGRGIVLMLSTY